MLIEIKRAEGDEGSYTCERRSKQRGVGLGYFIGCVPPGISPKDAQRGPFQKMSPSRKRTAVEKSACLFSDLIPALF